jgi:hypothetical protein
MYEYWKRKFCYLYYLALEIKVVYSTKIVHQSYLQIVHSLRFKIAVFHT